MRDVEPLPFMCAMCVSWLVIQGTGLPQISYVSLGAAYMRMNPLVVGAWVFVIILSIGVTSVFLNELKRHVFKT